MILRVINRLRIILTPRQKYTCVLLLVAILIAAVLELMGIGLVLPVIAVLTSQESADQNSYVRWLYQFINPSDNSNFMLLLCGCIAVVYVLKNVLLLGINYFQSVLGFGVSATVSRKLFSNYIHSGYTYHLQKNSSDLIYSVTQSQFFGQTFIHPLIIVAADAIIITVILLALFIVSPVAMLGITVCSVLCFLVFYPPLKKLNHKYGERRTLQERSELSFVRASFEGLKEYKVRSAEDYLCGKYGKICQTLQHSRAMINTLGQVPRLGIEALVICLGLALPVAAILYGMDTRHIFLTLSLLLFAIIRIMPSISRIQYNVGTITAYLPMIQTILDEYFESQGQEEKLADEPLAFTREIEMHDIVYRYPGGEKDILDSFSLRIPANSAVAFVGATGSGKTTIIDILLGLLKPQQGSVLVDGVDISTNLRGWRRLAGYVPQSIFLMDATVAENVALGVDASEIDRQKVEQCLRKSQILEFVQSLPQGLDTVIGENGMRFSGGQRQRIGIARALYHDPRLLVLDEATSALDNQTEQAFMDALDNLKGELTIVIIAHRLSTTRNCDQIIDITHL